MCIRLFECDVPDLAVFAWLSIYHVSFLWPMSSERLARQHQLIDKPQIQNAEKPKRN